MNSILRILMSGLVPVLGLVSCTPKSPGTVEDSFRVAPPVITPAGTTSPGFKMNGSDGRALPTDAEVTFDVTNDTAELVIETTSTCVLDGAKFERTAKFKNVARIPLLSLLSPDLWLRHDIEVLNRATCAFHFKATNALRSTEEHHVSAMPLAFSAKSLQLQVNKQVGATAAPVVVELPDTSSGAAPAFQLLEPDESATRDLHMICDHFHTHTVVAGNQSSEPAVRSLATAKEGETSTIADARDSYHSQVCRFFSLAAQDNGVTDVKISPSFSVRFPFQTAITLEVGRIFSEINLANPIVDYLGAAFISLSVKNISKARAAYRFPLGRGNTSIRLTDHFVQGVTAFAQLPLDLEIIWSIKGAAAAQSELFTLEPGQSVTLEGTIAEQYNCYTWNFGDAHFVPGEPVTRGKSFSLSSLKPFEQILNFAPTATAAQPTDAGAEIDGKSTNASGWIAAPLSDQLKMPLNASEVVRPRRGPGLEQGCFKGPVPPIGL